MYFFIFFNDFKSEFSNYFSNLNKFFTYNTNINDALSLKYRPLRKDFPRKNRLFGKKNFSRQINENKK